MIEINQVYTHDFQFTQENVIKFAEVTGDNNPLHLDAEYASHTRFKRPIIHGMLGASIFSKILGTVFPGEGSIYLKQSLIFVKPMFVDTAYQATFTVINLIMEKNRIVIKTEITEKEAGKLCITGEATIINEQKGSSTAS